MPDLSSNVVANVLAYLIIAAFGWLLFTLLRLPFIYKKRKRLFEFLGITKDNPKLTVYLSTVFVVPGGSVDFRGSHRTFAGPAVPAAELSTVEPLVQLFEDPLLDGLPIGFRKWLGERVHWSLHRITPVFSASPQDKNQVQKSNMLTVGSQYYNSAGDLYAETGNPLLKFVQHGQNMVIQVNRGPRKGDIFQPRDGQRDDLAIVERIHDKVTKSTVFFAAGLGVTGTIGAVQYLVDNWQELYEKNTAKPFAICLRFQEIDKDPDAYKKPIELSRFQNE